MIAAMQMRAAIMALTVLAACGESAPAGPVVLFQDKDAAGLETLFQLDPRSGRVTSVAAVEGGALRNAVFAASGAGGAAIVTAAAPELVRWTRGGAISKRALPAELTGRLVAASKDGTTVAMNHARGLAIVHAAEEPRVVELADLGELAYLVALSSDGSKLAFSTFGPGCGWSRNANTCPVTLYVLDVTVPVGRPVRVAGGERDDGLVAYDPQFLDPAGDELLYLTSAGDREYACRTDVGKCRYALHRVRRDGTGDTAVVEDAVLGRPRRDGAIVHRRLGSSGWSEQSLWLWRPGDAAPKRLATDAWMNRVHAVSPKGDQVAVVLDGPIQVLDVLALDGGVQMKSAATAPSIVGWSVTALPAGARQLPDPVPVRQVRAAVERARALAGTAPVATIDIAEPVRTRAATAGATLDDIGRDLAPAWLARGGVAVTRRATYCVLRDGGAPLEVAERAAGDLLIIRAAGTTPPEAGAGGPAVDPTAPAQARFTATELDVELVAVALPPTLRPGTAELALTWRVVRPPSKWWKVFVHLDGKGRIQGDHAPAECGAGSWRAGDVITDRFVVEIPAGAAGPYTVGVGWFWGANRATALAADGQRAGEDKLVVGTVEITGQ